jgi:hypothetical protein
MFVFIIGYHWMELWLGQITGNESIKEKGFIANLSRKKDN